MSFRDDIINSALNWADPGQYKPTASELISFFTDSSTQQAPSQDEAQKSLDRLGTGCYVGGQVKHWCGIFACSVAVNVGLNTLRWDLMSGQIRGADVQKKSGSSGIQPGDIAVIAAHSRHFIVTDVNRSDWNGQTVLPKLSRTIRYKGSSSRMFCTTYPSHLRSHWVSRQ